MSIAKLDLLNIVLMLLALGLAFAFPFETFLVSYTFIGPLHYLTEISWLHDRKNFCARRLDAMFLIVPAVFITYANPLLPRPLQLPIFTEFAPEILLFAFLMALVLNMTKVLWKRVAGFLGVGVATALFSMCGIWRIWILLLLPSVVHVFLFTGSFILLGALRNRSWTGILSLAVFLGAAALSFAAPQGRFGAAPGRWARGTFEVFAGVVAGITTFLGIHPSPAPGPLAPFRSTEEMYIARAAIRLMTFLSFIYLYHYLNWFSKTHVIGWHRISKVRVGVIVGMWILSAALYLWDFKTGFLWLYFLSLAHVLLEFPLNWLSLKENAWRLGGLLRIPGMARGGVSRA